MTVGQALRAHLLAQSAVTALVAARVYPSVAPEGTVVPLVTYDLSTTAEGHAQDASRDGLAVSQLTVTCEAEEHDGAVALRSAVTTGLFTGAEAWGTLAVFAVEASHGTVEWDEQTQSWIAAMSVTVQHARET